MRNRLFFSTIIGGLEFKGLVSADGPYISCEDRFGGVALGVCGLLKFNPGVYHNRQGRLGWWLVKYDSEARLDLTDFSDSEVQQLSDAFGIVLLPEFPMSVSEKVRQGYFFTSPAWEALRSWIQAHPRLAMQYARYDSYLPGWYERSVAARS